MGENECVILLNLHLQNERQYQPSPLNTSSNLDCLVNLTTGREVPRVVTNCWAYLKAGWLHGSGTGVAAAGSFSVSGSASAVRYEKTNGTQMTLMAALRMREKKMKNPRLEDKEGLTKNHVGKCKHTHLCTLPVCTGENSGLHETWRKVTVNHKFNTLCPLFHVLTSKGQLFQQSNLNTGAYVA